MHEIEPILLEWTLLVPKYRNRTTALEVSFTHPVSMVYFRLQYDHRGLHNSVNSERAGPNFRDKQPFLLLLKTMFCIKKNT